MQSEKVALYYAQTPEERREVETQKETQKKEEKTMKKITIEDIKIWMNAQLAETQDVEETAEKEGWKEEGE